jgi:hypothetical protein
MLRRDANLSDGMQIYLLKEKRERERETPYTGLAMPLSNQNSMKQDEMKYVQT